MEGAASSIYEQQQGEFELLDRLNRMVAAEYPEDAKARARIKSYELAFRMQRACPKYSSFSKRPRPRNNSMAWTMKQRCRLPKTASRRAG